MMASANDGGGAPADSSPDRRDQLVARADGLVDAHSSEMISAGDAGAPVVRDAAQPDAASGGPLNRCTTPLAKLRTGPNEQCSGGNEHHWPVGMAEADCHGWSAVDPSGREHLNSASGIRCNEDGSFQFTQFAGNLDCSGSGVTKVYVLNMCTQDIPPRLHTLAFDLTCCSEPDSPDCEVGIPLVTVPGGVVYLNGEACSPE